MDSIKEAFKAKKDDFKVEMKNGDFTKESLEELIKTLPKGKKLPRSKEAIKRLFKNSLFRTRRHKKASLQRTAQNSKREPFGPQTQSAMKFLGGVLFKQGRADSGAKGKALMSLGYLYAALGKAREPSDKTSKLIEFWSINFENFFKDFLKERKDPRDKLIKNPSIEKALGTVARVLSKNKALRKDKDSAASGILSSTLHLVQTSRELSCLPPDRKTDERLWGMEKGTTSLHGFTKRFRQESETKQVSSRTVFFKFINHPKYRSVFKVKGLGEQKREILLSSRITGLAAHGQKWVKIKEDPEIGRSYKRFMDWMKDPKKREKIIKSVGLD